MAFIDSPFRDKACLEEFLQFRDILDRDEVHDFLCFGDGSVLRDKRVLRNFVCKSCKKLKREWILSANPEEGIVNHNCNSCRNLSGLKNRVKGWGVKSLTDKVKRDIIRLRSMGMVYTLIGEELGLSYSTVRSVCIEDLEK